MGRTKNRRKVDTAQRVEAVRQATAGLRQAIGRWALALSVVCALGAGGWFGYRWALTSPTFGLKTISFHGLRRGTEAELTRLAAVAPGQNLFQLDTRALAKALSAHPWVRAVDVSRSLPGSLFVVVHEHEPAAMVSLGDLYLLNRDGEPFRKVQAGDELDLPLVSGMGRDEYMASPPRAAERLSQALRWLKAYEQSDRPAGAKVSEVRLEAEGVTLVTALGQEVRFGDEVPEEALARLSKVSAELARRGWTAEVIHLDNRARPGWVTVKVQAKK